jgi:hypothetical protein
MKKKLEDQGANRTTQSDTAAFSEIDERYKVQQISS